MSKAVDAFRTISEVADELAVPKHVLRFWEAKFSHIRPMKRGGGRRYYRPEDLELLRGIRHLLHKEGFTIKGVQKILREQGVDGVKRWGRDDPEADGVIVAPPITIPLPQPESAPATAAKPAKVDRRKKVVSIAKAGAPRVALPAQAVEAVQAAIAELERCRALLSATASPVGVAKAATAARTR